MNIPFAIDGRIVNTEHSGHVVRVEDDRAKSGGFFIHQRWLGCDGPDSDGGSDYWVEDEDSLTRYFAEAGWSVEWAAA